MNSSRDRELYNGLLASIERVYAYWQKQVDEEHADTPLNIRVQLAQLQALGCGEWITQFCARVSDFIYAHTDMPRLGCTAYESLNSVGYDCRGFDWMPDAG